MFGRRACQWRLLLVWPTRPRRVESELRVSTWLSPPFEDAGNLGPGRWSARWNERWNYNARHVSQNRTCIDRHRRAAPRATHAKASAAWVALDGGHRKAAGRDGGLDDLSERRQRCGCRRRDDRG